jgi:carbon storage regulator
MEGNGMLVLTRKIGAEVVIDKRIRLVVVSIKGNQVRLGISAPPSVLIDRQEVYSRRLLEPVLQPLDSEDLQAPPR